MSLWRIATGAVPAGDDAERRRWFYTPADHGGLTLPTRSRHSSAARCGSSPRATPRRAMSNDGVRGRPRDPLAGIWRDERFPDPMEQTGAGAERQDRRGRRVRRRRPSRGRVHADAEGGGRSRAGHGTTRGAAAAAGHLLRPRAGGCVPPSPTTRSAAAIAPGSPPVPNRCSPRCSTADHKASMSSPCSLSFFARPSMRSYPLPSAGPCTAAITGAGISIQT